MKHPVKVFKFGGASLRNTEQVKNVVEILKNYNWEVHHFMVDEVGAIIIHVYKYNF